MGGTDRVRPLQAQPPVLEVSCLQRILTCQRLTASLTTRTNRSETTIVTMTIVAQVEANPTGGAGASAVYCCAILPLWCTAGTPEHCCGATMRTIARSLAPLLLARNRSERHYLALPNRGMPRRVQLLFIGLPRTGPSPRRREATSKQSCTACFAKWSRRVAAGWVTPSAPAVEAAHP